MWESEKKAVLDSAVAMVESGLAVGTSGNVSMKVKGQDGTESIAVTPTNCYRDTLTAADIVVVDFEGKVVEGKLQPSSELKLHIGIYRARPDVYAIVHSHSLYGSVLSVTGQKLPAILDDQVACLGGEIEVAPYELPGSRELAEGAVSALGKRNAVILANHGTVGVGSNLREAFNNCRVLEKTAMIYVHALSCGSVKVIPEETLKVEDRGA